MHEVPGCSVQWRTAFLGCFPLVSCPALAGLVVELQCPGSVQMRRFTKKELGRYNGKDGAPAFIAYAGRVYDVSRSFLWKNGRHQALHAAGADMTSSLDEAPHTADVLKRFPMVGTLREDSPPCGP